MTEITIGVPVYNGEKFLDSALKSLCAQTYKDLKIFISDNGSTDKTPEIIQYWMDKDSRIHLVRHEKTMTQREHFAWLIQQSDTKYFCFAAYDDLWSPNYIEALMQPLLQNPDAWVSIPRSFGFEVEGQWKDEKPYYSYDQGGSLYQAVKNNFKNIKSGAFYGLYNREYYARILHSSVYFQHIWGIDFQTFLNFIFTDKVVGNNDAIFYQRYTGISDVKYRPVEAADQWAHYKDFWKEIGLHLGQSNLSSCDKIKLLPTLYQYASRVVKPKRIVKSWVKELLGRKTVKEYNV